MDQTAYLGLQEVRGFIEWLRSVLSSDSPDAFVHNYVIEQRYKSNPKLQWRCTSLFDAFKQYTWQFSFKDRDSGRIVRGASYSESEAALNDLMRKLTRAIDAGDNNACFNACAMILDWGGVLGSKNWGNQKRLLDMQTYLASYLKSAKEYFEGDCELKRSYGLELKRGREELVMNAGFTKIYSLLCRDFIIYDGRVGAAFALLVGSYLHAQSESGIKDVPESLGFYYGNAKNPNINRNPSVGRFRFRALSTSSAVHIRNNLKANWIVGALNLEESKGFSIQNNPVRAFEAALFMIGYRI